MANSKHRRILKRGEDLVGTPEGNQDRIRRAMMQRVWCGIADELSAVRAPTAAPGQKKWKRGPSILEQTYGEDYTLGQHYELAIHRAVGRLEELMRPGYVTQEDLRPHLDKEDLSEEGRREFADRLIRAKQRHLRETGGELRWDALNKKARKRRQDDHDAREQEWRL